MSVRRGGVWSPDVCQPSVMSMGARRHLQPNSEPTPMVGTYHWTQICPSSRAQCMSCQQQRSGRAACCWFPSRRSIPGISLKCTWLCINPRGGGQSDNRCHPWHSKCSWLHRHCDRCGLTQRTACAATCSNRRTAEWHHAVGICIPHCRLFPLICCDRDSTVAVDWHMFVR